MPISAIPIILLSVTCAFFHFISGSHHHSTTMLVLSDNDNPIFVYCLSGSSKLLEQAYIWRAGMVANYIEPWLVCYAQNVQ